MVRWATVHTYSQYLDNGVRVFEYNGPRTLHAKTLVIDGQIACVGSFNLDLYSALVNLETMVVIPPTVTPVSHLHAHPSAHPGGATHAGGLSAAVATVTPRPPTVTNPVATYLLEKFRSDLHSCHEVTRTDLAAWPLWQRALVRTAHFSVITVYRLATVSPLTILLSAVAKARDGLPAPPASVRRARARRRRAERVRALGLRFRRGLLRALGTVHSAAARIRAVRSSVVPRSVSDAEGGVSVTDGAAVTSAPASALAGGAAAWVEGQSKRIRRALAAAAALAKKTRSHASSFTASTSDASSVAVDVAGSDKSGHGLTLNSTSSQQHQHQQSQSGAAPITAAAAALARASAAVAAPAPSSSLTIDGEEAAPVAYAPRVRNHFFADIFSLLELGAMLRGSHRALEYVLSLSQHNATGHGRNNGGSNSNSSSSSAVVATPPPLRSPLPLVPALSMSLSALARLGLRGARASVVGPATVAGHGLGLVSNVGVGMGHARVWLPAPNASSSAVAHAQTKADSTNAVNASQSQSASPGASAHTASALVPVRVPYFLPLSANAIYPAATVTPVPASAAAASAAAALTAGGVVPTGFSPALPPPRALPIAAATAAPLVAASSLVAVVEAELGKVHRAAFKAADVIIATHNRALAAHAQSPYAVSDAGVGAASACGTVVSAADSAAARALTCSQAPYASVTRVLALAAASPSQAHFLPMALSLAAPIAPVLVPAPLLPREARPARAVSGSNSTVAEGSNGCWTVNSCKRSDTGAAAAGALDCTAVAAATIVTDCGSVTAGLGGSGGEAGCVTGGVFLVTEDAVDPTTTAAVETIALPYALAATLTHNSQRARALATAQAGSKASGRDSSKTLSASVSTCLVYGPTTMDALEAAVDAAVVITLSEAKPSSNASDAKASPSQSHTGFGSATSGAVTVAEVRPPAKRVLQSLASHPGLRAAVAGQDDDDAEAGVGGKLWTLTKLTGRVIARKAGQLFSTLLASARSGSGSGSRAGGSSTELTVASAADREADAVGAQAYELAADLAWRLATASQRQLDRARSRGRLWAYRTTLPLRRQLARAERRIVQWLPVEERQGYRKQRTDARRRKEEDDDAAEEEEEAREGRVGKGRIGPKESKWFY